MFPLKEFETIETAKGVSYKVRWKGSSVLAIEPKGTNAPLYAGREWLRESHATLSAPRYP